MRNDCAKTPVTKSAVAARVENANFIVVFEMRREKNGDEGISSDAWPFIEHLKWVCCFEIVSPNGSSTRILIYSHRSLLLDCHGEDHGIHKFPSLLYRIRSAK